jgi:hypothetical protein
MRTRYHFNALFLLLVFGAATDAEAQVDPQLAQRNFDEATRLCERDAGRLWGVSLCGPLVIFDPATGTRATSHPEPPGPPPRFPGFADGPVTWGGQVWFAAPLYMLPENDADLRQQLLLHALFHRIQGPTGVGDRSPRWHRCEDTLHGQRLSAIAVVLDREPLRTGVSRGARLPHHIGARPHGHGDSATA